MEVVLIILDVAVKVLAFIAAALLGAVIIVAVFVRRIVAAFDAEDTRASMETEENGEFLSEAEIIEDLSLRCKDTRALQNFLEQGRAGELTMLHHTFGTHIRNHYKLWNPQNPHTMKGYVPELRDGVDYSPRHPDAVSMRVIDGLYQKLSAEVVNPEQFTSKDAPASAV